MNNFVAAAEPAVSHYSDWQGAHWAAYVGVFIASLLALGFALDLYSRAVLDAGTADRVAQVVVAAVCVALVSVVAYWVSLYQLVRHCSTWKGALFFLIVGALAAGVIVMSSGIRDLGALQVAALAGPYAVGSVVMLIWDGITRVAAWVPTPVGMVVLALCAGALWMWNETSPRSRSYY